jgi:O-antigen/teichoic acid export membrane protein
MGRGKSGDLTQEAVRPTGRSLTGRASLNAVASGLDYGVRAIVELVVSPLLVAGLGAQMFGAWRVLWQWSGYVWGASGRSAQALQYAIANRQWTATPLEKRRLVGCAIVVWLCFLPLMLLAGALGVWLGPAILDVPSDQVAQFRVAAAILAVDAMVLTLTTLPRSTLQGENLGYTRMGASTLLVAVGGALLVVAVKLDLGLPGVAGATLLTTVLTGWVFWHITRRRLPWFGASRPPRHLVRWFLGLSAWFLGWKFVLELMIASDVLILGAFGSLSLVAAFALTKFVADSLMQVLALLVQATIPGIGGYLGAGNLRKAGGLRGEVMALVWLAGTAAGATIIVWNGPFVGLWVNDDLYAGDTATVLIVVLALQIAIVKADTYVIDVALVPRVKVVAGVAAAVASIGLAVVGVQVFESEVVGLCVGLLLGRSVLGIAAPWAVGRVLGLPLRTQLAGAVRPLLVTVAVFTAAYLAAERIDVDSWPTLVAGVAVTVAVLGALSAVAGLSRVQRRRLVARARALAPGSRAAQS